MADNSFDFFKTSFKQHFDLLKHVTTLDTGAIVILATFFSNNFANTIHNGWVKLCIGEFMLSLVLCVSGMLMINKNMVEEANRIITNKGVAQLDRLTFWVYLLSIISFALGVEALAAFILSNIKI